MSKQTFDFSEALRRMKEGKKVRRIGWGIVDKLWIAINILFLQTNHALFSQYGDDCIKIEVDALYHMSG